MIRKIYLATIIIMLSVLSLNAQDNEEKKPIVYPDLKPTFMVADIYFAIQSLESIEITGTEVKAFLEVKKEVVSFLEEAKKQDLKVKDNIKVTIPFKKAQNLISFLNRTKMTGRMAEQFNRFVDAIVDAAKEVSKK